MSLDFCERILFKAYSVVEKFKKKTKEKKTKKTKNKVI